MPRDCDLPSSGTTAHNWTLDQLGNWAGLVVTDGSSTTLNQTRYHNAVNEIDGNGGNSITGTPNWADPAYDLAGNMTLLPRPASPTSTFTLKYDAWNRLESLSDPLTYVYEYDGLGRRIGKTPPMGSTNHYYYNEQWQLLETRVGSSANPQEQFVWHPSYVDALAVRYWDQNYDGSYGGTNEGAQFYQQDANFNVTAVVNSVGSTGTVLERYRYSPYGEVTVLVPNFQPDGNNSSDIENTHLYTGRERDPESGLQLNRHRYYASHLGRWLTQDPIEYSESEWNLYCYSSANPAIATDPSGLDIITLVFLCEECGLGDKIRTQQLGGCGVPGTCPVGYTCLDPREWPGLGRFPVCVKCKGDCYNENGPDPTKACTAGASKPIPLKRGVSVGCTCTKWVIPPNFVGPIGL